MVNLYLKRRIRHHADRRHQDRREVEAGRTNFQSILSSKSIRTSAEDSNSFQLTLCRA
jgi:hypothetical protein